MPQSPERPRRFYKLVEAVASGEGFVVRLDQRGNRLAILLDAARRDESRLQFELIVVGQLLTFLFNHR